MGGVEAEEEEVGGLTTTFSSAPLAALTVC